MSQGVFRKGAGSPGVRHPIPSPHRRWAGRYRVSVTAKEKLHERLETLSEEQAARLLAVVEREKERPGVGEAIAAGYRRIPQDLEEQAWAEGNAREAIREERW